MPTFTVSAFLTEEIFSQTADFCLALSKVLRICNNLYKAKIFKPTIEQAEMTCEKIQNSNQTIKLCADIGKPNPDIIQSNPNLSKFIYAYAKQNFALLQYYIKDPYYTLIKCDEQISTISFIGNAGGLMGLCMGLSLISIFEMVYHFINFCSAKIFQK